MKRFLARWSVVGVVAIFVLGGLGLGLSPPALAGLCQPGWLFRSQQTNSHDYNVGGVKLQWIGWVQLWKRVDGNCNALTFEFRYGGNPNGGTAVLRKPTFGHTVFLSFTLQLPPGFTDYNHVSDNARGDLVWATPPAGNYPGYHVEANYNNNPSGADEYDIVTDDTIQHTISSVQAFFDLPPSFMGATIIAEIHGGFNYWSQLNTFVLS